MYPPIPIGELSVVGGNVEGIALEQAEKNTCFRQSTIANHFRGSDTTFAALLRGKIAILMSSVFLLKTPMPISNARLKAYFLTFAMLLTSQFSYAQFSENPVLTLVTRKGVSVNIFSELSPLDINKIHSWLLRVDDADGNPLKGAAIQVIGGMPEHDHGLPTQPQITAETKEGEYLLEGVRFHMPGKWQLDIEISYGSTTETASTEFSL